MRSKCAPELPLVLALPLAICLVCPSAILRRQTTVLLRLNRTRVRRPTAFTKPLSSEIATTKHKAFPIECCTSPFGFNPIMDALAPRRQPYLSNSGPPTPLSSSPYADMNLLPNCLVPFKCVLLPLLPAEFLWKLHVRLRF